MPKLKVLSADEIVSILNNFDFVIVSQKGSHIKLRRIKNNVRETLVIPNHKELDRGTLRAIHRQSCRYISEDSLSSFFFSD